MHGRCSVEHEILGADIVEHGINSLSEEERQSAIRQLAELGLQSPFDKYGNYIQEESGCTTKVSTQMFRKRSNLFTVTGVEPAEIAKSYDVALRPDAYNGHMTDGRKQAVTLERSGTTNLACVTD